MAFEIRIDANELIDYLDKLDVGIDIIESQGTSLFHEAGVNATELSRTFAPVKTGRLRNSIQLVSEDPKKWSLVATAPYAIYVEQGYQHINGGWIEPLPFMGPAVDLAIGQFMNQIMEVIKDSISVD